MTVQPEELSLAAEFPDATRGQWQQLVANVLTKSGRQNVSGPAAEDALATDLRDGVRVHPLYTAEDVTPAAGYPGFPPFARGGRVQGTAVSGWDVRQLHTHPDARRSNEAVLADLENGVTSLWLVLGPGGLPIDALPTVLTGVYLDLASVTLDAGADFAAAAEQLFALYVERGVSADAASGNLGADPLGLLARTGDHDGTAAQLDAAAILAQKCVESWPGVRALVVDALPYHEAGASAAQELGCSLAAGVAYLRVLTSAGLSVDDAAGQLEFRYAATADQFETIAKLRAARRLWARVAEVSGVAPESAAQRQHVVTSSVMMAARDPWVNMLRTTVACLAAGVGGADAVTVLPFDTALGLPDDFARRVARNTQSILQEESHLARVIDPAGGSWYVESLTDELARAAWAWFQRIERSGGLEAALDSGMIAETVAGTWAARESALARRREPITGVSEFPNLHEAVVVREQPPAALLGGGGLPRVRLAQAFETLRDRSDARLADVGARPKLVLAAIGPAAVHTARSSFAANLFQAGGIETVLIEGADAGALAEAFAASGATVACLCSSDALYEAHAETFAAELKAASADYVLLAGRPGERREAYQGAGVDEFVFVGCDAVGVLTAIVDRIGAAS